MSEIDEIVDRAENCQNDYGQCSSYAPDINFLPLPKIGGEQLTIKQMEEHIAALRLEVESLKVGLQGLQNTANDGLTRANQAQNTADAAQNSANQNSSKLKEVQERVKHIQIDAFNSTIIDAGPRRFLAIQSDGNVVVCEKGGGPLWGTGTNT